MDTKDKIQHLISAEEIRNQTNFVMQPYAKWEEYLTPAMHSIAILGELVFISSSTDFSINQNPPKDGFKHIKYPESFHACLIQVCNSVQEVFSKTHKNMDQIRVSSMAVPDYMKVAIKILFQGNQEVVQAQFPDQLKNICVIVDNCLALAELTEKFFRDIINVVQELLEACLNIQYIYEEELEDINWEWEEETLANEVDKINIYSKSAEILACADILQQFVHDDSIDWNNLYDQRKKTPKTDFVKGQFIRINSSLDVIPACKPKKCAQKICKEGIAICNELEIYASGSECEEAKTKQLIKKIRKLTASARAFDSKTKDAIRKMLEKKSASERVSVNTQSYTEQSQAQLKQAKETCPKMVENLEMNQKEQTEVLVETRNCEIKRDFSTTIEMPGKGISWERKKDTLADEMDEMNIYSKSAEIQACADILQQFVHDDSIDWKNLFDQKKTPKTDFVKGHIMRICSSLDLIPTCKPRKHAQEICKEGIAICNELAIYAPDGKCEEAKTKQLIKKIRKLTASARAFDSKTKDVIRKMLEKKSASERVSVNTQSYTEQSQAQPKEAKEACPKMVENLEKNQKEQTGVLVETQNCEIKRDINTTLQMLWKKMDAMIRMKEQWEKMVCFFQMVSNIVKTSMSAPLKGFVNVSEKIQSFSYDAMISNLLYTQAFQVIHIASLIHMISAAYTEFSEKYLMDAVSSLGQPLTMDMEMPEFLQERLQLQNSCKEAHSFVCKNKAEFEKKNNSRLEMIGKELLALLPTEK